MVIIYLWTSTSLSFVVQIDGVVRWDLGMFISRYAFEVCNKIVEHPLDEHRKGVTPLFQWQLSHTTQKAPMLIRNSLPNPQKMEEGVHLCQGWRVTSRPQTNDPQRSPLNRQITRRRQTLHRCDSHHHQCPPYAKLLPHQGTCLNLYRTCPFGSFCLMPMLLVASSVIPCIAVFTISCISVEDATWLSIKC